MPAGDGGETSLYLRPFMFASEAFLGVRPAAEVTYCVIASPAGAYFAGGLKPVSHLALHRLRARRRPAAPARPSAAATTPPAWPRQVEAHRATAATRWSSSTPSSTLGRGARRDEPLLRAPRRQHRHPRAHRDRSSRASRAPRSSSWPRSWATRPRSAGSPIEEWREGAASGDIAEVFACGTAAVVTPVGQLAWDGGEVRSADPDVDGGVGPVTAGLRRALLDVQYGRTPDTRGWLTRLA